MLIKCNILSNNQIMKVDVKRQHQNNQNKTIEYPFGSTVMILSVLMACY